jgi:hypothetical protein
MTYMKQVSLPRTVTPNAGSFSYLPGRLSICLILALTLWIGVAWVALAQGPTCTVTSTADSGANSLRQCISEVDPGGTINFNLTYPATIALTTSEITIDKALTINGPGAAQLAISGDDTYRIFYINAGSTDAITVTGLTIRDGYVDGDGGGIYNSSGYDVEIQNCIIAGNGLDISGSNIEDYLISRGYNIIGTVTDENFQYNATGDLYGDPNGTTSPNPGATESPTIVNANLAPLADNGAIPKPTP